MPQLYPQSEAPVPKLIVVEKLRTSLYVNYGLTKETRSSLTPGKGISVKKRKNKSIDTSPPRKDPIPNHDKIL